MPDYEQKSARHSPGPWACVRTPRGQPYFSSKYSYWIKIMQQLADENHPVLKERKWKVKQAGQCFMIAYCFPIVFLKGYISRDSFLNLVSFSEATLQIKITQRTQILANSYWCYRDMLECLSSTVMRDCCEKEIRQSWAAQWAKAVLFSQWGITAHPASGQKWEYLPWRFEREKLIVHI